MTTVQFNKTNGYASTVDQRNFYGTRLFDEKSVGTLGNFTTLNAQDADPYGPWMIADGVSENYRSHCEDSLCTQEIVAFRSLHQELQLGETMELKAGPVYKVMSGWKKWNSETATTIADGADGSDFEIWYEIPGGASTLALSAATAILAIFAF